MAIQPHSASSSEESLRLVTGNVPVEPEKAGPKKGYGTLPRDPDALSLGGESRRLLRWANITFALLLFGAIPCLIVARVALDVAAPLLEKDPQLSLDHVSMSRILSGGVGAYGLGKVFAGLAVDTFGAKRIFLACMAMICLACTLFGSGWDTSTFFATWAVLKFFQSFIWPTGVCPSLPLSLSPFFVSLLGSAPLSGELRCSNLSLSLDMLLRMGCGLHSRPTSIVCARPYVRAYHLHTAAFPVLRIRRCTLSLLAIDSLDASTHHSPIALNAGQADLHVVPGDALVYDAGHDGLHVHSRRLRYVSL